MKRNRRGRYTAGTNKYPGRDGETAKRADPLDGEQDWTRLVPFARVREANQIIRIETDGQGNLVEFVESSTSDRLYGGTRVGWRKLRAQEPVRVSVQPTSYKRTAKRLGTEDRILVYLRKHAQSKGARAGAVAAHIGTSSGHAATVLYRLRDRGYVHSEVAEEPLPNGGTRTYARWYASDMSHAHLFEICEALANARPVSPRDASALMEIEYERVVKAFAHLYNSGQVTRTRECGGYVYGRMEETE